MAIWIGLLLGAFLAMEGVAYLLHRYVMHGPLWVLHESHHRPRAGRFERNDLFGVFFALPSMLLIYAGTHGTPLALPLGIGMTAYGAGYFLLHDVLVHRRIRTSYVPRNGYLKRLVRAHLVHHRTLTKQGATCFGFLYAREPTPAGASAGPGSRSLVA